MHIVLSQPGTNVVEIVGYTHNYVTNWDVYDAYLYMLNIRFTAKNI